MVHVGYPIGIVLWIYFMGKVLKYRKITLIVSLAFSAVLVILLHLWLIIYPDTFVILYIDNVIAVRYASFYLPPGVFSVILDMMAFFHTSRYTIVAAKSPVRESKIKGIMTGGGYLIVEVLGGLDFIFILPPLYFLLVRLGIAGAHIIIFFGFKYGQ